MARPKISLFAWSADTVARELGIKRDTFVRSAANLSLSPDKEGKWTSKQVFLAITGNAEKNLTQERINLLQQQIKRLELENKRTTEELVGADTVYKNYEGVFICLRQTIMGSNMTDAEKAECLAQLRHDTLEAKPIE